MKNSTGLIGLCVPKQLILPGLPHSEGESLGAEGNKRLGRTRFPQNGDIGGSVAASEQSEEPPLTRLRFWAGAPTTRPRGEMLGRAIQLLEYQMVRALCRFDIN